LHPVISHDINVFIYSGGKDKTKNRAEMLRINKSIDKTKLTTIRLGQLSVNH